MISEYFDAYYFLISLFIGILCVYLFSIQPQVIMKYPTPNNLDTIYKDKNDVCYKYNSKEVKCSIGTKDIEIQHNDENTFQDKILGVFK